MVWGVGTGHCGTTLLANNMKGRHQPAPKLMCSAPEYYNYPERAPKGLYGELEKLRDLDTPIVVSHKYSLCMDAIIYVDPKAEFIWLLRDPSDTIRSDMQRGLYDRKTPDKWVTNRIKPTNGFPAYFQTIDKTIWRYWLLNQAIEQTLLYVCEKRWRMQLSEELPNWKPSNRTDLAVGDHTLVQRQLRPYYARLVETYSKDS